jgi:ribosome biogenesis GTPase / thiamine phosphate phosphatase
MKLEDLGYNNSLKWGKEQIPDGFEAGRVVAEHKERYSVRTATDEYEAEITGNMRYTAQSREDFPAVGDWVVLTAYDAGFAIIHSILPRSSVIKRQAVGQKGEVQVIAANIDCAFLVQAVDRDFNINRLERYLAICLSSKVSPVIVLTKTDLADEARLAEIKAGIGQRIEHVPVIAISNETHSGYDALTSCIEKGKTYCMLGSSGVGKSTLLNNLSGRAVMKTDAISKSTSKGRHVTSHRELIVLGNGGILIDNPGMREVGIADTSGGLEAAFDKIALLSEQCRFADCTHTTEIGCAVLEALEKEELNNNAYENYLKLERERAHYETTAAERRKKEKSFGKVIKDYLKKDIKNREH